MPSRFDEHPARREDATPVLFIGATGRCGSTLLDRILGQHPAVFAAGELNRLWEFGLRGRGPCGCGAALIECPVWGQILEQVYGAVAAALEAAAGNEASERLLRTPTSRERWVRDGRASST